MTQCNSCVYRETSRERNESPHQARKRTMSPTSLEIFIDAASSAWSVGGLGRVEVALDALTKLASAEEDEPWLAGLLAEKPASRELYRDPAYGFILLAHNEYEALYRPPHDHGRAWVVYAVQSGALEVGTYKKVAGPAGDVSLVQLDRSVIRAGEARAYLLGEIHDTKCVSENALLLRFTERDLRHEVQVERMVTRFVMRDGHWIPPLS